MPQRTILGRDLSFLVGLTNELDSKEREDESVLL